MKVSRIAALLFISFTGLSRAAEPLHHFNTSSIDHLIILTGDGGAGGAGGAGGTGGNGGNGGNGGD
ncbi:hypothetical protein AB6859_08545 [Rahnella inusitata]|uniref:hypothetical protein n=1 Tax=Rahnella inusitata TaxID=58169 RepID=UPI0039BE4112